MITLGIETSCDETALALLETKENNGTIECRVISSLIHSQADLHSAYGGVFPTLAKREHSKNLLNNPNVIKEIEENTKKIKPYLNHDWLSEYVMNTIAEFNNNNYKSNNPISNYF
jgi:tRNA A37 threonylcarbamoyltransferase TsaD